MKDTTNLDALEMDNGWYRIPERETTKSPIEFPVGAKIKFSRVIGRAGYRVEYTDVPNEELNKIAIQVIQERIVEFDALPGKKYVNQDISNPPPGMIVDGEIIKAVLGALDFYARDKNTPGFNMFSVDYQFHMDARYSSLKWVYKEARRRWFCKQPSGILRTFWYNDLPDGDVCTGIIRQRPVRQIGKYWPASPGSYYDPYDYDPAGLEVFTYQQVYDVDQWSILRYAGNRFRLGEMPYRFLVHPLDAELA